MKNFFIALCAAIVVCSTVSCNKNGSEQQEATANTSTPAAKAAKKTASVVPAVSLLDSMYLYDDTDGKLTTKSGADPVVIGSGIKFLGTEKKFGKYLYAKIQSETGDEGWVSAYRIAENAVPAVITKTTELLTFPSDTAPAGRKVPAGQIVAVSLENGITGGYAKIIYCYYTGKKSYSNRIEGYVNYDILSTGRQDISCGQVMTRAIQNPDYWQRYADIAMSTKSVFLSSATFPEGTGIAYTYNGKDLPDSAEEQANKMEIDATVPVLTIPILSDGEPTRWYPVHIADYFIIPAGGNDGAVIDAAQQITSRPDLPEKEQKGESVVLLQSLSLRKQDPSNSEKLVWSASLNLAECNGGRSLRIFII